jgi:acyl carrier protein
MVPATFSTLNALPRTPSGKIDRQSLPEPTPETEETSSMAPRTQVETQLVEIWQEILQTDNIGIQANFFDLGGHSLLATQVISRVRNAFGVDVPLRSLFESPTIADLAVLVEQALAEQVDETELSQWLAEIEADS